ncbi:MAG: hypothetical protein ACLRYR_00775 [Bifidobacterium dentium]
MSSVEYGGRISDSLTNVVTAADINAPSIMNGMACSISPAMPVVMRTSGMVRPCVSNARDAAMRKAASGAPTMKKIMGRMVCGRMGTFSHI